MASCNPRLLALALFVAFASPSLAWEPPVNPDPSAILREAEADTRAGRYEEALAKHLWYHEHAEEFDPGQSGVRVSFALGDWRRLADQYPPAMKALVAAREVARKQVLATGDAYEPFSDFAALSRELGKEQEIVDLFRELDEKRPDDVAAKAFKTATPALVRAKEYELLGKYVEPQRDFDMAVRLLGLNNKFASKHPDPMIARHSERTFSRDVCTLVATLVVNNRADEAELVAEEAREHSDDKWFRLALDKALKGEFPDQRP
jgi:tetratricopeptide (TPR) repeat protein